MTVAQAEAHASDEEERSYEADEEERSYEEVMDDLRKQAAELLDADEEEVARMPLSEVKRRLRV